MSQLKPKIPVSVVIPVKNEQSNLPFCLSRLTQFSEIVVVDSSSTDRTPEIAREFGVRYINFDWNGEFPKKRNWLLMKHTLKNEWVLFLDADEFVDGAFCAEIDSALKFGKFDGYWLNYSNWFLGRKLNHGVAQRKLALFRVGSGLYEKIDESRWSKLDMEIHEHPQIVGPVGEIMSRIDHRDDRGIAKFVDRHCDYAMWEKQRIQLMKSNGTGLDKLTRRQQFKYRYLEEWWFPWFYFLFQFVAKAGFLDGTAGFHYAFYKSWYFQTIRLMLKEGAKP